MMTRQMPYSAGAPSRAIVPLAMLSPPKSASLKLTRHSPHAGCRQADFPREGPPGGLSPRPQFPEIFVKTKPAPSCRTGIPPVIYAAKVKVKGGFYRMGGRFPVAAFTK